MRKQLLQGLAAGFSTRDIIAKYQEVSDRARL